MAGVRHRCGYSSGIDVPAVGTRGGLSMGWKEGVNVSFKSSDDCEEEIRKLWTSCDLDVPGKLNVVSEGLTRWSKHITAARFRRTKALKRKLDELNHRDPTSSNLEELILTKLDLNLEIDRKERKWEQRARANWLSYGDRNTAYFHKFASHRKKMKEIKGLEDQAGILVNDESGIEAIATGYFAQLFHSNRSGSSYQILAGINFVITTDMNNILLQQYTNLFLPNERQWDIEKISNLFDPEEAARILSIPLATDEFDDELVWRYENSGFYTVKSGHKLLQRGIHTIHPSVSDDLKGNETDRLSLLAIKDQIKHDPFGRLMSWNESSHFCHWLGVTGGRKHQRVVQLSFNDWELVGRLGPDIGNMSFLRVIDLQNNSFSDRIPPELGLLFRLQMLLLMYNKLIGEIPVNVSRCSRLQKLNVGDNNLTGKLPVELGFLSNLRELVLQDNNLLGEIPSSLVNISFLEVIYGSSNNFQGGIPERVGQLRRLKVFALGDNNLSGSIPTSMYNISSLTAIDVILNRFRGSLPHNLGETLPNLTYLGLGGNQFTGLIPSSLSNASNLNYFDIGANNFAGRLPTFARQQNLQRLILDS
ncbi:hypothetical protein K2173_012471 [Erythroxylum novogranatense]|uniref:Leucine-rich repeat-containing N-terminal plant-type domain-containing protein n=1 Tax=Erythroxylum novogranatense TaxID=1862640 RepID=A0AAV8U4Z6_9ROSI|nr:hypothetical protein K2173_012471 [Erythroxylum novogranatense]